MKAGNYSHPLRGADFALSLGDFCLGNALGCAAAVSSYKTMKRPKTETKLKTIMIQDDHRETEETKIRIPKRLVWSAYALGVKPEGLAEWLCDNALSRIDEIRVGEVAAKLGARQGDIVNLAILKEYSLVA